jgi:hypothetical protein
VLFGRCVLYSGRKIVAIPLLPETWAQMFSVHPDYFLRLDRILKEREIERWYAWWSSVSAWIVLNLRLSGQLRRWVGDMKEFSLLGVLDMKGQYIDGNIFTHTEAECSMSCSGR